MNPGSFYNPYLYTASSPMFKASGGLFSKGLLKGASWSSFLTTAGKTLNVINQAIPVFYQVRPIIQNAKTMFRVLGAVKGSDRSQKITTPTNPQVPGNQQMTSSTTNQTVPATSLVSTVSTDTQPIVEDNGPTFFL
ncbi:MAG TPA: hypothetical protein IAB56_04750 [Candidatus Scybalousia intestinigallinarum]|nr:hypothetical protein [Candidatus Scybalousia intestinigallinarum]